MARASYSTTPLLRSLVHRPQGVILVTSITVGNVQGVSQITLQTQNAISPEIMLVFPQKFHCTTGRSYPTTY